MSHLASFPFLLVLLPPPLVGVAEMMTVKPMEMEQEMSWELSMRMEPPIVAGQKM